MARFLALLLAALVLSSCASMFGNATQEITFLTPGVNDSICFISNGDINYRVWPPEKIRVSKRPGTMEVTCLADGNREKIVMIEPEHVSTALANGFNGFAPGLFIDYETGALFEYPNTISVDFSDMAATAMPLPGYHKHLMENPQLFGMEEFHTGRAALIKDKNAKAYKLQKKDAFADEPEHMQIIAPVSSTNHETVKETETVSELTKRMNPKVFGTMESESASTAPMMLLPMDEK
ncbi:MAG: hypothetical protein CO093_09645 [Alphaproteobacteria bacterium CG_4_9_14_3_um_filter_47_13]|nr:MAG: hypothetical protein CO093_09645 [Alphaproteobacteria bacterium CG_4_9_14_3_um_filter_47_13]